MEIFVVLTQLFYVGSCGFSIRSSVSLVISRARRSVSKKKKKGNLPSSLVVNATTRHLVVMGSIREVHLAGGGGG